MLGKLRDKMSRAKAKVKSKVKMAFGYDEPEQPHPHDSIRAQTAPIYKDKDDWTDDQQDSKEIEGKIFPQIEKHIFKSEFVEPDPRLKQTSGKDEFPPHYVQYTPAKNTLAATSIKTQASDTGSMMDPVKPQTSKRARDNRIKIVIVGEKASGKSLLALKLFQDAPIKKGGLSTGGSGANFETYKKCIEGRDLQMKVWDTSGDPMHRIFLAMYTKETDILIVVFNPATLTSISTLADLSSLGQESTRLLLLGNIFDTLTTQNNQPLTNNVALHDIEQFAKDKKATLLFVDLLHETKDRVRQTLEDIVRTID